MTVSNQHRCIIIFSRSIPVSILMKYFSLVHTPLMFAPLRYSDGLAVHISLYSHVPRTPYCPPHGSPNVLGQILQHPHVSGNSSASGHFSCTRVTFSHCLISQRGQCGGSCARTFFIFSSTAKYATNNT